jgi:hypothetical protein
MMRRSAKQQGRDMIWHLPMGIIFIYATKCGIVMLLQHGSRELSEWIEVIDEREIDSCP